MDRADDRQIELTSSRNSHRLNILVIAGLIACAWQARKPSLRLPDRDMALFPLGQRVG